nr:immunoglobulin heavy chain junction region [Mus musculus]
CARRDDYDGAMDYW